MELLDNHLQHLFCGQLFFENFCLGLVGWLFSYKGDEILTSCCGWQMVDVFFSLFFSYRKGVIFFCNSCIGSTLGLLSYSFFFHIVGWLFEAKAASYWGERAFRSWGGDSFFPTNMGSDLEHQNLPNHRVVFHIPPRKLKYPLKNDGWKMYFLLK